MTLCGFPPLLNQKIHLQRYTCYRMRWLRRNWSWKARHNVVWRLSGFCTLFKGLTGTTVDDLRIWPIGQACKYGQSFRWWLLTYHVPAMTSLSIYSCWIMLIGGPPKQIAFGMNIGSWCDLTASCVQNMSFQNCMLCIFVPVTSKYICDSLRSMVKLKLEPFHKQTSLSDPLEVSCH